MIGTTQQAIGVGKASVFTFEIAKLIFDQRKLLKFVNLVAQQVETRVALGASAGQVFTFILQLSPATPGVAQFGTSRHGKGEIVLTCRQQPIHHDLLAHVIPIAIPIEIDPSIQIAARCGGNNGYRNHVAFDQHRTEDDTVVKLVATQCCIRLDIDIGTEEQGEILALTVESAKRSNDLATLRYSEGFSDYERVLNAQQALFNQQLRYVANRGDAVTTLANLYTALGGGWENRDGLPYINPETLEVMQERTDWGGMIDDAMPSEEDKERRFRKVDW